LNQQRVEVFRALMENQQRIADALIPCGVTPAQIEAAIAAVESTLPRDERDRRDFFVPALDLYVRALDGRLEPTAAGLAAAFPDVTVAIALPLDAVDGS
jgi:hypothetical protein